MSSSRAASESQTTSPRRHHHRPRALNRLPSTHVPERFKYGDDAQTDVTAPPKVAGKDDAFLYPNQSIFSMIAAAGAGTNFNTRFEESSESESESEASATADPKKNQKLPAADTIKEEEEQDDTHTGKRVTGKHRRKLSERGLFKAFPRMHLKSRESGTKSTFLPPQKEANSPVDLSQSTMLQRQSPVMGRMLEAKALHEVDSTAQSTETLPHGLRERAESTPATLLATRLKEIFGFDTAEDVVSEYPCWLMQSVLLQGYLYITQKHVCFYAYLPKNSSIIAKSGHLSKKGHKSPRHTRYWFTLKGDVLSYYLNPADLYFPSGTIDLTYGISAALAESKDKSKEIKDFTVTTDNRTYYFHADSATSAKEWVKTLQKTIFRSRNDGDSVKISIPIQNILDIEESPLIDLAETFRIRVVESEETYAIDEYFFSFFNFGAEAFETLKGLVDGSPMQKAEQDLSSSRLLGDDPPITRSRSSRPRLTLDPKSRSPSGAPALRESVKATLSPLEPRGRASGDYRRSSRDFSHTRKSFDSSRDYSRASFDRGRRSGSTNRMSFGGLRKGEKSITGAQDSSDSFVHSMEQGTDVSGMLQSSTEESASQILNRSDVFQSPTINRIRDGEGRAGGDGGRRSEDTARSLNTTTDSQAPKTSRPKDDVARKIAFHHAATTSEVGSNTAAGTSAPTLQELVKAGSYPLQRAAGFAGYLRNKSKHMSSLLATESMGYMEKVSGMWVGGGKHYGEDEAVLSHDKVMDPDDDGDDGTTKRGDGDRFRAHFALPPSERLQAAYFGWLHRVVPLYGKIYISNRKLCFRSLLPGTRTKLILPLKDVENVEKEKGFRFGYHGLVLVIRGHEELFFEFNTHDSRDDCAVTLHQSLESIKFLMESGLLAQEEKEEVEAAKAEHRMLQEARQVDSHNTHDLQLPTDLSNAGSSSSHDSPTVIFDDPRASILNFKPTESMRITCLTIGSRGDVQPYIALCKGLLAEGHKPKIATHAEFEPWIRKHGIDFAPVGGDPAELMRICVENGMFTISFLKEASVKFRGWLDELLSSAWGACQGSDLLIESPSAMAGIHIAQALGIPYFRAFTMPWTRTRAYPHAFAVPEHKLGGAYNYFSYVMFDNVFWKAIAGQVNRWRKRELHLRSTNLDRMRPNTVPFLYNFSPSVVVPPLDYSDWIRVTGYWFLDEGEEFTPPQDLAAFIARARADGKKIVYIGFGSIVVSDPPALTRTIIDSVLKADVRCILSKGWSDRLEDANAPGGRTEVPLPPEIIQIKSAPHDWLFRQVDAVAHHGGAGTTGASLRAGVPTIVKPFFGDQFFFGGRVEDLGVGIYMRRLNVSVFSRALWEATHDERMIVKAQVLGEQIRRENGVDTAIKAIYRDMEYAKTIVKARATAEGTSRTEETKHSSRKSQDHSAADDLADIDETWTFIGDDSDPELVRRIHDFDLEKAFAEREARRGAGLGDKAFERGRS